jgi:Xaa-Pro aminopeptidase/Xaa-Pro dipeptidase
MTKNQKTKNISKACKINDKIFAKLLKKLKKNEFKTEKDIAKFIDKEIKKARAKNAFQTIVATAENAVDWHHKPNKTKLKKGFCVIDFGARVNKYCGDMTRTIYFGEPSKKEKKIYSKVLRANQECIKMLKPKTDGNKIYKHALKILGKHAKYFNHSLGHGLSKIIHANPKLSKKPNQFLKTGDIITIEPGIYLPKKFGIRIEDDILITKKSHKILSHSTKKLIKIKIQN